MEVSTDGYDVGASIVIMVDVDPKFGSPLSASWAFHVRW
jgi:hypothetical protein